MTWKVSATRRGKEKQGSEHDMLLAAYLRGELSGASGQARGSATRKLRGQRGETAASRHHRLWEHCIQTCSTKGFLEVLIHSIDEKEVCRNRRGISFAQETTPTIREKFRLSDMQTVW